MFAIVLAVTTLSAPIREVIIGGCSSTEYGCCQDNVTSCVNQTCYNCEYNDLIGGCSTTEYGCCQDNITSCNNTSIANMNDWRIYWNQTSTTIPVNYKNCIDTKYFKMCWNETKNDIMFFL